MVNRDVVKRDMVKRDMVNRDVMERDGTKHGNSVQRFPSLPRRGRREAAGVVGELEVQPPRHCRATPP